MPGSREFIENVLAAADEARTQARRERAAWLARHLVRAFVPELHVSGIDLRALMAPGLETPDPAGEPQITWEPTGFRRELIAGGQNGEAVRHLAAAAAVYLARRRWLVLPASALDWVQGLMRGNRREARAEIAGNRSGVQLGRALRAYLRGTVTRESLARQLHFLLEEPQA